MMCCGVDGDLGYPQNRYADDFIAKRALVFFVRSLFSENARKNRSHNIIIQLFMDSLELVNKKVLIKKTRFAFSAIPSINHLATNASGVPEGGRKIAFLLKTFFGKIREKD